MACYHFRLTVSLMVIVQMTKCVQGRRPVMNLDVNSQLKTNVLIFRSLHLTTKDLTILSCTYQRGFSTTRQYHNSQLEVLRRETQVLALKREVIHLRLTEWVFIVILGHL